MASFNVNFLLINSSEWGAEPETPFQLVGWSSKDSQDNIGYSCCAWLPPGH